MTLPRNQTRNFDHHQHRTSHATSLSSSRPPWARVEGQVRASGTDSGVASSLGSTDLFGVTPPASPSSGGSRASVGRPSTSPTPVVPPLTPISAIHKSNSLNPLTSLLNEAEIAHEVTARAEFSRAPGGVRATPSAGECSATFSATLRGMTTSEVFRQRRLPPPINTRLIGQTYPRTPHEQTMGGYTSPHRAPDAVDRGSPRALANFGSIPNTSDGPNNFLGKTAASTGGPRPGPALSPEPTKWTRYVIAHGLSKTLPPKAINEWVTAHVPEARTYDASKLASDGQLLIAFFDVHSSQAAIQAIERAGSLQARSLTREQIVAQNFISSTSAQANFLSPSEGICRLTFDTPRTGELRPQRLLVAHGGLRSIDELPDHRSFIAEFFDERAAERAVKALDGAVVDGVRVRCSIDPLSNASAPISSRSPSASTSTPPLSAFTTWDPLNRGPSLSSPGVPPFVWDQQRSFNTNPPTPASPALSPAPGSCYAFAPPSNFNVGHGRRASASSIPVPPASHGWQRAPSSWPPPAPLNVRSSWPQAQFEAMGSHVGHGIGHLSLGLPPSSSNLPSPAPTVSLFSREGTNSSRAGKFGHSRGGSLGSASSTTKASPPYGIYREDKIPVNNQIDFGKLELGQEVRTTIMLKNLPNKLTAEQVMDYVDEMFDSKPYDGFYLRIDFAARNNVGYAFINFLTPQLLLQFLKAKVGTRYNLAQSDKICSATWANIQGRESFIDHFRNSSVMDQPDQNRPKIFYSHGPMQGQREPFPECTDPLRKQRSATNQRINGLFPSQKPEFKVKFELKTDQTVPAAIYQPPHARQA